MSDGAAPARVRVVIVEDHALVRAGLRTSLEAAGIAVVAEASDGIAGLETVTRERPDVAVIDLGLPGKDGIALTRELKANPDPPGVVILTMQELDDEVLAALAAGADAYCVKSSDPRVVIDAIAAVAAGGAYFDPRIAHVVLRKLGGTHARPPQSPLTPRETQILTLVADGIGNAEIAERLHVGLGTVKGHIADILEKLSASDRAQAAVTAYRRGLIS
ncbi:MAG: Two component transcriptional regulator, LuxR family [Candidatus Eremiobacteraeota bacterium]|jgi:DNA-binding NarL/FixJ family response regulator|nr:Two component transcriptional regulator, LuxR family [Candidatus Eremiobacteraeota bacterium]